MTTRDLTEVQLQPPAFFKENISFLVRTLSALLNRSQTNKIGNYATCWELQKATQTVEASPAKSPDFLPCSSKFAMLPESEMGYLVSVPTLVILHRAFCFNTLNFLPSSKRPHTNSCTKLTKHTYGADSLLSSSAASKNSILPSGVTQHQARDPPPGIYLSATVTKAAAGRLKNASSFSEDFPRAPHPMRLPPFLCPELCCPLERLPKARSKPPPRFSEGWQISVTVRPLLRVSLAPIRPREAQLNSPSKKCPTSGSPRKKAARNLDPKTEKAPLEESPKAKQRPSFAPRLPLPHPDLQNRAPLRSRLSAPARRFPQAQAIPPKPARHIQPASPRHVTGFPLWPPRIM